MTLKLSTVGVIAVLAMSLCMLNAMSVFAQSAEPTRKANSETKLYRAQALSMLDEMKATLKEHYYDPNYHGIDLEARFAAAKARVKTLDFNWQMYRVLVQVLMEFDDSHTSFFMPPRSDFFDYGFSMQMIGNDCYVVSVKKGSDAEKKGVVVGTRILHIGQYKPTRDNLWKIIYSLYKLDPATSVELQIETLAGEMKAVVVDAKTMTVKERREELKNKKTKEDLEPYKCAEINSQVIACKLYTFSVPKSEIDKMMKDVGSHTKLILDLRGNGGGYVMTEEHLISQFFSQDVKIADVVTRKKKEVRMSKGRGAKAFSGDLVVLVDSRSASAAEMFSRVIQIEKRGKIIGDYSMGAVMTSIAVPFFKLASALSTVVFSSVGMSVTIADVIMSDGSRLEKTGVTPDLPIIPNALALSKKLDPVLSVAAGSFGATLTPEDAAKLGFAREKYDDEGRVDEQASDN